MTVTISERGQMVLPAEIRKRYGIRAHSKVEVLDKGGEIVIVPLPKGGIKAARGILKGKISTADLIRMRREDRKREDEHYKKLYGI